MECRVFKHHLLPSTNSLPVVVASTNALPVTCRRPTRSRCRETRPSLLSKDKNCFFFGCGTNTRALTFQKFCQVVLVLRIPLRPEHFLLNPGLRSRRLRLFLVRPATHPTENYGGKSLQQRASSCRRPQTNPQSPPTPPLST